MNFDNTGDITIEGNQICLLHPLGQRKVLKPEPPQRFIQHN